MKILGYNPWNFEAEPGDIMIDGEGRAWRLFAHKKGPKAAAGELSMYPIKRKGYKAIMKNGQLEWVNETQELIVEIKETK